MAYLGNTEVEDVEVGGFVCDEKVEAEAASEVTDVDSEHGQ